MYFNGSFTLSSSSALALAASFSALVMGGGGGAMKRIVETGREVLITRAVPTGFPPGVRERMERVEGFEFISSQWSVLSSAR